MSRKAVTDDFKVFPERLSALMKERGKRQQDLAEHLGIKRQTVSLYMKGLSMPDAEQLKKIALFWGVSADWLLGLSDIKSTDINLKGACAYTGLSEEAAQNIAEINAITDELYKQKDYDNADPFCDAFEMLNRFLESDFCLLFAMRLNMMQMARNFASFVYEHYLSGQVHVENDLDDASTPRNELEDLEYALGELKHGLYEISELSKTVARHLCGVHDLDVKLNIAVSKLSMDKKIEDPSVEALKKTIEKVRREINAQKKQH